ncbi:MAG: GNAT family N-acetyltransferase [Henriciella sp.]|uniref:GNAT family N-acetyltransferase n=1 Tax=Henriciella sp. TaxID=1968823 RepID=UPI003C792C09
MNARLANHLAISPATPDDVDRIIEIDLAAGQLFAPTGLLTDEALDDHVPADILLNAVDAGFLDVARTEDGGAVGFVLVSEKGAGLYLDQISVDPAHGKMGVGRMLMDNLFDKAARLGVSHISLSTFRDLRWNAPFYRRLGFEEIARHDFEPYMVDIERAQAPFMDVSKRVFMKKVIRKAPTHATKPS